MTWTSRPENTACCSGSLGAVDDSEFVARHLHSRNSDPDLAAFERKMLTGEGLGREPSNDCGDADGCSVDRIANLSKNELLQRAEIQAGKKPDRVSHGCVIAHTEKLRAIRQCDASDEQAVFVYDDPMPDNDEHAVLRLKQGLPRPDFKDLQRQIVGAFSKKVA